MRLAVLMVAGSLGCGTPATVVPIPASKTGDEREALAQATLDIAELQQYFHTDTLPERKPLPVVVNGAIDPSWKLRKFGEPVQYVDETTIGQRAHVVFTLLRVEGNKAGVTLRYAGEGVVLHAEFARDANGWRLVDSEVAEE